jgi:hypothetical protein
VSKKTNKKPGKGQRRLSPVEMISRLHVGLRPKLQPETTRDLELVHLELLDSLMKGDATEETAYQIVAGLLTHWAMADSRGLECTEVLLGGIECMSAVIARADRLGRWGLSGPEYQSLKECVEYEDAVAKMIDAPTAMRAADWSEMIINKIADARANASGDGRLAAMQALQAALGKTVARAA